MIEFEPESWFATRSAFWSEHWCGRIDPALTTLLYKVSATDAATFAGYSAALVLVGLLASYVSARATRIDVVRMLRQQ
jgi:hypothetical protein